MKIQFKNIKLNNFMSFNNAFIDLDKSGFTLISGENNCAEDNSKSNGSGKSSIIEALVWSLTGETLRGIKDVKKRGTDKCSVTLTFLVDKDTYEITRTLPSGLEIIKNGEDIGGKGIKASKEILEQELPEINLSLLSSIVVLGQGLPNRFSNNTPAGRKEVLEKLFKADFMIEDIKNRISDRIDTVKTEQRTLEDNILSSRTKLDVIRNSLSSNISSLESLQSPEELHEKLASLQAEVYILNDEKNTIELQNKTVNEDNEKINNQLTELSNKRMEVSNDTYLISEIEEVKEKGINLKNDKVLLDKEIASKDSITDTCPTCGQKLIGVEKPDTTEDKKKSAKMEEELNVLRAQLKDLQSKREEYINNKLKDIDNEYNIIKSSIKSIISTSDLDRKITNINNEIASITNEINVFNNKRAELEKSIVEQEKQIKEIDEQVNNNLNDKIKLDGRIDVINKINTLIKRDFRGYLLSNIISLLDSTFKEYANEVFGHANVEVAQDGNNIVINFNNKPYESLSGGEKKKIDICLQLALKDVLSKYNNFYTNIFLADEIFDELDMYGSNKIIDLINSKVNVPSVFVITHNNDIENILPIDNKIIVKKNDKGSIAIQL